MAQTRQNTKPRKCDKNPLSCLLYLKMETVTFKQFSREISVGNCLHLSCLYISCCWICQGQTRPPMLTSLSLLCTHNSRIVAASPPPSLCTFKPRRAAALSFLRRILKQGDIISRIARIPPSPSLQEPFGARKEEEEEEEQFLSHLASPQLFPPPASHGPIHVRVVVFFSAQERLALFSLLPRLTKCTWPPSHPRTPHCPVT